MSRAISCRRLVDFGAAFEDELVNELEVKVMDGHEEGSRAVTRTL